MKEIIEIYSKIVVATFGFIGPSFTLLISIFIEAIEKSRMKKEKQLKTTKNLYNELYKSKEGKDMEKQLKNILKENDNSKKLLLHETNLLNPRRQIKRVFIPLILSLFFISFYYFARTHYCRVNDTTWVKIVSVLLSGICFVYCLFVLWQILNMVIDAKQAVIKDKTDKIMHADVSIQEQKEQTQLPNQENN